MHTIFVSSTYIDLIPERRAVQEAILRLQQKYAGMEYFGSDPERPREVSLRFLSSSSIYVGILAHRYGAIEPNSGKSFTHLEYEAAREAEMPTLLYIKSNKAPVTPTSKFIDFDTSRRERLGEFKSTVLDECVIQKFETPRDLAAKVTADLSNLILAEKSQHEESGLYPLEDRLVYSDPNFSTIPMVGEPAVGKTCYGCAIAHDCRDTLSRHRISLHINQEGSDLLRHYEELKRGRLAPPTTICGRSKAEILLRRKRFWGSQDYRLQIFDTSGEEWNHIFDPEYDHRSRYGRADFLVSLLKSSGLAIFIPVKVAESHLSYEETVDYHYANIIAQLRRDYTSEKYPRPVAVLLTKCDIRPDLLREPKATQQYIEDEYPQFYSQLDRSLRRYRIFPVSVGVAGCGGPEPSFRLDPIGIWDPIIWLIDNL